MQWFKTELQQEIKRIFEPRYKRKLLDGEVIEIAENLADVVEQILRLKWKQKYEN
jgi:hypothetical protein